MVGTTKILGFGAEFACSARTNGTMDKRRRQADLTRKLGLESTFHEVLIVVESGDGGDNKKTRDLQKSAAILLIAQVLEELWTNEDHWRIQRTKMV